MPRLTSPRPPSLSKRLSRGLLGLSAASSPPLFASPCYATIRADDHARSPMSSQLVWPIALRLFQPSELQPYRYAQGHLDGRHPPPWHPRQSGLSPYLVNHLHP